MKKRKYVLLNQKGGIYHSVSKEVQAMLIDEEKDSFTLQLSYAQNPEKKVAVRFESIGEMKGLADYLLSLAKELKGSTSSDEMEKSAHLNKMTFKVTYVRGTETVSHLTTYQGAFDLLGGRLQYFGVTRDAKAAALRAFEDKCWRSDWDIPYEAGVITISKVENEKILHK